MSPWLLLLLPAWPIVAVAAGVFLGRFCGLADRQRWGGHQ